MRDHCHYIQRQETGCSFALLEPQSLMYQSPLLSSAVIRGSSMAIVDWFPLTFWKKCLTTWRCISLIHHPNTPRKGPPTAPTPTLPPLYRRENGYIILAALSARPCVHPSSVLSLDFRFSLPPLAVYVLFIVCVCPCGDSGDSIQTNNPLTLWEKKERKRGNNPVLGPFLVSEKGRSKA